MGDSKHKYRLRARYEKGTETYVPPAACVKESELSAAATVRLVFLRL